MAVHVGGSDLCRLQRIHRMLCFWVAISLGCTCSGSPARCLPRQLLTSTLHVFLATYKTRHKDVAVPNAVCVCVCVCCTGACTPHDVWRSQGLKGGLPDAPACARVQAVRDGYALALCDLSVAVSHEVLEDAIGAEKRAAKKATLVRLRAGARGEVLQKTLVQVGHVRAPCASTRVVQGPYEDRSWGSRACSCVLVWHIRVCVC